MDGKASANGAIAIKVLVKAGGDDATVVDRGDGHALCGVHKSAGVPEWPVDAGPCLV